MEHHKRTVTCGALRGEDAGRSVVLNGWVHRTRDHGGISFFNLRDRYGLTQVVVDSDADKNVREAVSKLHVEYCVAVEGQVRLRPETMRNSDLATGEIEVVAERIVVLTASEPLPFAIDERSDAREDLRLKHRYLDLRSFSMQEKIILRHKVAVEIRKWLSEAGFLEIETPTLIRSTPEGARDFLVPSRLSRGHFYALPQSPQLYKQLLMASGFDKYFQIAHCFRDEDARGDRQPEHTQIDIEMSFVSREDVFALIEGLFSHVFKETLDVELTTPFPRLSYADAMNRYGSDKPDLRFALEMGDFGKIAKESTFAVFSSTVQAGGAVKYLVVPGGASLSRKEITDLEDIAKTYRAKGLAWMKVGENGLEGGVSKFFSSQAEEVLSLTGAAQGDIILFVADEWNRACTALGAVRTAVGRQTLDVSDKSFMFCWIEDFPLFEWNEDEERWEASHHMFTMPQEQFLDSLESDPGAVLGDLYDLVCNGVELASGSIRIHDPEIQRRIFGIVGFDEADAEERFGFLLEAFRYGAPPHGGIAPGLDRLLMLMSGESTIREVIAFPKNTVGASPLDGAPGTVRPEQLEELGLEIVEEEEE